MTMIKSLPFTVGKMEVQVTMLWSSSTWLTEAILRIILDSQEEVVGRFFLTAIGKATVMILAIIQDMTLLPTREIKMGWHIMRISELLPTAHLFCHKLKQNSECMIEDFGPRKESNFGSVWPLIVHESMNWLITLDSSCSLFGFTIAEQKPYSLKFAIIGSLEYPPPNTSAGFFWKNHLAYLFHSGLFQGV